MSLREATGAVLAAGEKALVPFFTAGYPDEDTFCQLLRTADARGCTVIEIGIPFSDPMADGPVIQRASEQALAQEMSLGRAIELTARVSGDLKAALVFMSYLNPILQMGFAAFGAAASAAGVKGVIIPDLPLEESSELREALFAHGITLIDLFAPTSGKKRIARIGAGADGFAYLVAVAGVTGVKEADAASLCEFLEEVGRATKIPRYVGFGVSTAAQAAEIVQFADGVIIGSALIKLIENSPPAEAVTMVGQFLAEVHHAINSKEGFES
jgi:tryptophan synthase alpha chain